MPIALEVERMIPCSMGYLLLPASACSSFTDNFSSPVSCPLFSPEQLHRSMSNIKMVITFFMIVSHLRFYYSVIYISCLLCLASAASRLASAEPECHRPPPPG